MKIVSVLFVSSLTVSTSFIVAPTAGRIGSSFCRVAAEQDNVLLYSDDNGIPDFDAMMDDDFDEDDADELDDDDEDEQDGDSDEIRKPHSRWSSLKQNVKVDLRQKKERVVDPRFESKQDKKRRELKPRDVYLP